MPKKTIKTVEKPLEVDDDGVPTYILRADSEFGLRAMITVSRMAESSYPEEWPEVKKVMRDFDLYEEANRE